MTHTGSRRETPFEDDLREWMKDPTFETEFRRWRADLARRGGAGRATKLTPEERSAVARKAGLARWGKDAPKVADLVKPEPKVSTREMLLQNENDDLRAEVDRLNLEIAALKTKAAKKRDDVVVVRHGTATRPAVVAPGFGQSYPAPKPSKGEDKPKRRFGRG